MVTETALQPTLTCLTCGKQFAGDPTLPERRLVSDFLPTFGRGETKRRILHALCSSSCWRPADKLDKWAKRRARFYFNGLPRYLHLYDNGGKTIDRYMAVFTGRYRHKTGGAFWDLSMSGAPTHPQGVGMHGESDHRIDWPSYAHLGKRIAFSDLPRDCQLLVLQTYDYLNDLRPEESPA